jgi:nicotinate dehydrogenase subunit B
MSEQDSKIAEYDYTDVLPPLDRRQFLQTVGGGIIILFTTGRTLPAQGRRGSGERPDFNAYLRIGQDGRVTCFTGKIEMGQGPITSLAQSLADELDVSLESVDMVMGDTALCPYDAGTWGSMTTPYFGPVLRAAGAKARAVLIGLAAVRLNVSKDHLNVENGIVFDRTNRDVKVSYAQLAEGKKIIRHLEQEPQIKTLGQYNLIGKSQTRIDAVEKVTGKAKFTGDIRIDGMVCAKVLRPPAHGAKLKSLDASAVENMEGFQVVRDGELVAVLHKYPDAAEQALSKIKAEYDIPEPRFDDKTVFDYFVEHAGEGRVIRKNGDVEAGLKQASDVLENRYLNGYVAHSPMEPHTALAKFEDDGLTVWASTQTPFGLRQQLSGETKLPIEKIHVIAPFVGGGFGGKISNGQAIQAVIIAKKAGKPVQLEWTREDEFFYDSFRPAAVVNIKSGINASGKIVSWDYSIYGMGGRGSDMFFDVPNHRTTNYRELRGGERMHDLGTGAWRAPDNNTNSFARESHMDVMAAKAGMDPLEFRLNNISDPKMRAVLNACAEKFGWTPAKTPSGRGFGVACGTDVGVPVALMAEVEVDKQTGRVQVKRVVCAQDMGLVINPEGAKMQAEGCITMGMGYALSEEVHFRGGEVLDLNFDTYELPKFSWVPEIEVVLIEASDQPSKGGGEPAIINMGGVIANAIHDAIGARIFQMPITPERIKQALA